MYDERAGIKEHEGSMSRRAAEIAAWREICAAYGFQHDCGPTRAAAGLQGIRRQA